MKRIFASTSHDGFISGRITPIKDADRHIANAKKFNGLFILYALSLVGVGLNRPCDFICDCAFNNPEFTLWDLFFQLINSRHADFFRVLFCPVNPSVVNLFLYPEFYFSYHRPIPFRSQL